MSDDEMQLRQITEALREKLFPFVVGFYICFVENGNVQVVVRGGGSGCACSTPTGKFFITCDHVLTGLQQRLKENPGCFIGATMNGWFQKLDDIQVLGRDKGIDVVAFTCDPIPILPAPAGHRRVCFRTRLPAVVPEVDETVYAFGYPGEGRDIRQQDHVFMALKVSSVSERGFVCAPTDGPREIGLHTSDLLTGASNMGGASGGPVFLSRAGGFQLVGVIKEGLTLQDTILFATLKYFTEDGSIDYGLLPPE